MQYLQKEFNVLVIGLRLINKKISFSLPSHQIWLGDELVKSILVFLLMFVPS
jgi:hypothetical protein